MQFNKEKFANFLVGKTINIDFVARDEESTTAKLKLKVDSVEFEHSCRNEYIKINDNDFIIYFEDLAINECTNHILEIFYDGYESINLCLPEYGKDWTEIFDEIENDELTNDEKLTLLYLLDKIDCDHCDYDGDTRCENSCVFGEALAALNTDFLEEYGFEDCDGCCEECERAKED